MSFWKNDPVVSQPKPILSLPNQRADQSDQRDEIRTDIAVNSDERADRGEVREVDKISFDQARALRDDYNSNVSVKAYETSWPMYLSALRTDESRAGDLLFVTAFAKLSDPTTGVLGGEREGVPTDSQSWVENKQAELRSLLDQEGGKFSAETRRKLRRELTQLMGSRNSAYNRQRQRYMDDASYYGLDPKRVIGPHVGDGDKEFVTNFWKQQYGDEGRFADGAPEGINMIGGVPEGSEIQWGGNTPGPEFDRAAWLEKTFGWTPSQEATYIDLLNKNAGKNLSGESLMKLAASYGIPTGKLTVDDFARDAAKLPNGGTWSPQKPQEQVEWERRVEELKRERDTFGGGVDAAVRGVADTASVGLADKGAALMDTVFDGGTYQDNLNEQYAVNAADEAVNPWARMGGQVAGGLAIPFGAGARTPGQLAKVGAAYGGGYEFNKSNEGFLDRIDNVAGGAAFGAAAGYGGGKLGNYIAGKFPARTGQPSEAREFIDAAGRQNIDYLPADIPGATATKIATGGFKQSLGGPLITRGADEATASVENAIARTTDNMGGAANDATGAGQAVQRGVRQWQDSAKDKVDSLYDKIPIKPDTVAKTDNTLAALRDVNNPIGSNPALSAEISDPKLKAFQAAIESGGLSWADLKAFRSYIGKKAGAPSFQQDIPKDRLDAIYAGLSRDIEATAAQTSPDALKAFQRANNYKRGVEKRRENVMKMLLGKDLNMSPEKTFAQMQSWGKQKGGDFAKLSQAVRSLPEEDANVLRATVLDMLGAATKGNQNAKGDGFSIGTLVTNWNDLSDRAKATLFQGDHRKAVDDIMLAADAMKASARYNNSSNTGATVVGTATLSSFYGGILPGIATVLGQTGAGALLGSPRVAKWMAAMYRKPNPQAAKAHILRLDNLAKTEPTIGAEIIQIKDYLLKQLAETPQRAAAEDRQESPQSSATTNRPQVGQ